MLARTLDRFPDSDENPHPLSLSCPLAKRSPVHLCRAIRPGRPSHSARVTIAIEKNTVAISKLSNAAAVRFHCGELHEQVLIIQRCVNSEYRFGSPRTPASDKAWF